MVTMSRVTRSRVTRARVIRGRDESYVHKACAYKGHNDLPCKGKSHKIRTMVIRARVIRAMVTRALVIVGSQGPGLQGQGLQGPGHKVQGPGHKERASRVMCNRVARARVMSTGLQGSQRLEPQGMLQEPGSQGLWPQGS